MTFHPNLRTALRTLIQPAFLREAVRVQSGSASLSDGMVRHIARDTKDHTLTSIMSRQIVDAQFRLTAMDCEEERYAQIRLIDDLMRRRAREIRSGSLRA